MGLLELKECGVLFEASIRCPRLMSLDSILWVLKVHVCKYLEDLKEGVLPSLRELDLSYGSICQSAIEELLSCCTHLTHVS